MKYTTIIIIMFFILLCSCSSDVGEKRSKRILDKSNDVKQNDSKNIKDSSMAEGEFTGGIIDTSRLHYPMDYNYFMDVLNDNIQVSSIVIYFNKNISSPQYHYSCICQGGQFHNGRNNSQIQIYDVSMNVDKDTYPNHCYYNETFNYSEIQFIYQYLIDNSNYFFSNAEFSGLEIPYLTEDIYFNKDNFNFSLAIYYPNPEQDLGPLKCYKISKSISTLTPDEPLYNLFLLLENNIFPNLTQQEEWCE